jgi:hypothetical protein
MKNMMNITADAMVGIKGGQNMNEKNLFELWNDKELPEEIQKEVDGFANAKYVTNAEKIFRAGFIIGLNNNRYKKIMGIEE